MTGLPAIQDLQRRVAEFNTGIVPAIQRCILENEDIIVEMNSEDQLYEKGQNALGVDISDYKPYTTFTVTMKGLKGQPSDRVTLRDEGDFHRSFYIVYEPNGFRLWASDGKTSSLVKKYGRQIFGLNAVNLQDLIWSYIYPDLIEYRKKLLYV